MEYLALDGQVSGSYPLPNPYPDAHQGTLCHKCHDPGFISDVVLTPEASIAAP